MKFELSKKLKKQIAKEMRNAPNKQTFHARLQREVYPTIKATTIVHNNNKIEIYQYE